MVEECAGTEQDAIPWRQRTRPRLMDVQLRWITAAAMCTPYVFLALLIAMLLGASDTGGLPLVLLFSVVAIVETVVLVLWFRRPTAGPDPHSATLHRAQNAD